MTPFTIFKKGKEVDGRVPAELLSEDTVGIFESLRTYGDHIFRIDDHLARFEESARTSGVRIKQTKAELRRELKQALSAFRKKQKTQLEHSSADDLFLRISLWNQEVLVLVGERKHSRHLYEQGVQLQTSPVRRTHPNAMPAQVKTSAYQNSAWASLESAAPGNYEWLFLDQDGYVTEVRIGNLFMVKGRELLTPQVAGILHGVTRKVVIQCALQLRLRIQETHLTRHDLYNADEAFLTNTSWEILPILALDQRRIGSQIPGPWTEKLQKQFRKIVKQECL